MARVEVLNEGNKNWNCWTWWEGKTSEDGDYIACSKCEEEKPSLRGSESQQGVEVGMEDMKLCSCKDELKVGQVDNWENFWETEEGQNTDFWTEEERKTGTKVKASELKKIRRKEWEEKVGYAEYMEDKEWMS